MLKCNLYQEEDVFFLQEVNIIGKNFIYFIFIFLFFIFFILFIYFFYFFADLSLFIRRRITPNWGLYDNFVSNLPAFTHR